MPVKTIRLKAIEARRYVDLKNRPRQIRIDHNSTVTQFIASGANNATVEFQYTTSYGPVGVIRMEGSLVYEDKEARKAADMWGKTKKMPDKVASEIHTAIMHACVPEAVFIAKDLALPPPIPLPQVNIGKGTKPAPSSGPEVA
ncbi:MAG: hypothetical protein FE035_00775 [Thermoplasmata archaeon]|nr:MAG: hypothetical protein FE035_00775 [Thermoplasmata archaeon]